MFNTPLNSTAEIPLEYSPFPDEGPRAIPLNINLTLGNTQTIDLVNFQQLGQISMVQAMYVDNSANPNAATFVVGTSNQTITAPPLSQGFYSLLTTTPFRCSVTSAGTALIGMFLLNIPVTNAVWYPASSSGTYTAGKLQVTDVVLDGIVSNGNLAVLNSVTGSGGTIYPASIGNLSKVGNTQTTTATLITGAPGYVITGFDIYVSPSATQTTPGDLTITLTDSSSGAIWTGVIEVGTAVATDGMIRLSAAPGFLWNNKVSASTLVLTLGASLTAGHIYYNINYALTSYVG